LKAGAIGVAGAFFLSLLNLFFPVLGYCFLLLYISLYFGAGALAARFGARAAAQTKGEAAGAGAIAGTITGAIGGMLYTIVKFIHFGVGLGLVITAPIPHSLIELLEDAGVDLVNVYWIAAVFGDLPTTFLCCSLGGTLFAAGLGALGGLFYASRVSPQDTDRTKEVKNETPYEKSFG
jgi:hypothetical protein